jgi:hypothetical protein
MTVVNGVTSAIGTVRSRIAALFTAVYTKSAMVGSPFASMLPGI